MTTIATLAVRLIADAAEFTQAMDTAERSTQNWATRVGKNMQKVGGQMTQAGGVMTAGVTLPLAMAGMQAIEMASDLEETRNKVAVVFGDMSNSVLAWSQDSATAMGQSQEQALSAAATYGNLFVTMGLGQKPAADMSMSLVGLAADLASFNNADPSDVLAAMQSGLVGQVEPMRKYGVVLNEAAIQAKAIEMGLGGANGELTEAEKLQARYAIILAQTTTAQGDFARTADGMANQTRIMKGQLADAAAALGVQLLPYVLQMIQWISQAVTWFQQLTPEQQKWIVGIIAAVAVIGPLLVVIGSLVTALGAIAGVIGAISTPVLIVIGIIVALIAIGYLLYQAWINNWGGIQEKTQAVIDFVKTIIAAGMQFLQDLTSGKLGALSALWQNTWNFIQQYIQNAITIIKAIFGAFKAAFSGDWYAFGQQLRIIWDTVWKQLALVVSTAWTNIKIAVKAIIDGVINFFKTTDWKQLGRDIIMGIVNGVKAANDLLVKTMVGVAKAALQAAKGFLGIKSPSRMFKWEIGWQMAAGAAEGLEQGAARLMPGVMPALAAMPGATVAGVGAVGAGGRGGAIVVENITYSPFISTNDEYEAERVLRDVVTRINRSS